MCGRYAIDQRTLDHFLTTIPGLAIDAAIPDRYNIAPSTSVPVIFNEAMPRLGLAKWGFLGRYGDAKPMINARSETVAEKPTFRDAFKNRRCIFPAIGFFEWAQGPGAAKTPWFFVAKDRRPLGLAGIWQEPAAPGEPRTVAIVTIAANELVGAHHDRMPVIVPPERFAEWLAPGSADRKGMLLPYPAESMEAYPVSKAVNKPTNDSPDLLERLDL